MVKLGPQSLPRLPDSGGGSNLSPLGNRLFCEFFLEIQFLAQSPPVNSTKFCIVIFAGIITTFNTRRPMPQYGTLNQILLT